MNYQGGKALGLKKLEELGCRVPPYRELVFPQNALDQDRSDLEKVLQSGIQGLSFPLIVRSNLSIEDGSRLSFAGVFESSAPVHDQEGLIGAVQLVFQAYQSPRALDYMSRNGIDMPESFPLLIQEFIEPEWGAILFSSYPEYPDELALHYVKGRPVDLVSGAATGKALHFNKKEGAWVEEGDIPDWAMPLCLEAISLEMKLGYPLDIEIVIRGSTCYFVQMRPITQAFPKRVVLDNSNIQESYYGVSLPLTFSFAQFAYASVYRQTMRVMRIPESTISSYSEVLGNLLYHFKGRIYYQIENWYKGLLLLPSFKRNKSDMETMMGLTEPVDLVEDDQRNWIQRLVTFPGTLMTFLRLFLAFQKLPITARNFRETFHKAFLDFYAQPLTVHSDASLLREWDKLDDIIRYQWAVPIINDFHVMILNGQFKRKWKSHPEFDDSWINQLMSIDMEIESLAPHQFYLNLAAEVRDDKELMVQLNENTHLRQWLRTNRPDILSKIEEFIMEFGDRVVGELKLESITLRQEPDRIFELLRNYIQAQELSRPRLDPKLLGILRTKTFIKLKRAIERREALRMDRTRLFGMYRSLFLEIGKRLQASGTLNHQRDVFLLNLEELRKVFSGSKRGPSLKELHGRSVQFQSFEEMELPGHLVLPQRIKSNPAKLNSLMGQVILGESLTGEAVCYSGEEDIPDLKGKILVAPRTDPGWVPLFPGCQAVLIEKGSSLSHSVIILREMGIPCMINIPGLCQNVSSGMHLRLNFETGEIIPQEHE